MLLVLSTALMAFIDLPLQTESAPWGIVSLELAWSPFRALRILLEWQRAGALGHAKLIQIADFVYLLIYGMFFATLAAWTGARLGQPKWASLAAWGATFAAGLDVLENAILLHEINRITTPSPWPELAALFAGGKFLLVGSSALYGIGGGLASVFPRYRRPL